MIIMRNKYSIMVWEHNQGLVIPIDNLTNLEQFTCEVRDIVLTEFSKNMRFVSLVYMPSFVRNFTPMKAFLNGRSPKIFEKDEAVKELFEFFFSRATKKTYKDGYVEYDF